MRFGVYSYQIGKRWVARFWGVGLGLLLVAVWAIPYGLAAYHLEMGGRLLNQALSPVFSERLAPEQIVAPELLESARAHLQASLRHDPRNVEAMRQLARIDLSQGAAEAALTRMQQAVFLRPDSPMLQLALGDVYDALGYSEEAIEAYEAGRIGNRGHPMAANYLKLADALVDQGSSDIAIGLWHKTLIADPGNLYSLLQLMDIHQALDDEVATDVFAERARFFTLENVAVPLDFRLAEYQGQAMLALVEQDIWDRATLLNVLAYQVWRFNEGINGLMTEHLLETVLRYGPDDPDLLFYQAELYHRRGDVTRAEASYQRVLAADVDYAPAYLRLGLLAVDTDCVTAIQWYEYYRALQPTDLLGAQLQLRAYQVCAQNPSDDLEGFVASQCSLQQIAADLLGVPQDSISVGENLFVAGDYETWEMDIPKGWVWSAMFNQSPFAEALFYGGEDTLSPIQGNRHARIFGLWVAAPKSGQSRARAGYWDVQRTSPEPVYLQPGATYLFSVYYRTLQVTEDVASVWLAGTQNSFWVHDHLLPPTDGIWQHFVAIGTNRNTEAVVIAPLLRSFGSGVVEFDAVEVYELNVALEHEQVLTETSLFMSGTTDFTD